MMMSQRNSSPPPPPLKPRHHRSSLCHLCCFTAGAQDHTYPDSDASAFDETQSPRSSSSCWWLRSTAPEEIRDRCRRLIGRPHRKAGYGPAEFGYDPSSYALNFEEKWGREEDDEEFPLRNFQARLPATPERPAMAKCAATPRRL